MKLNAVVLSSVVFLKNPGCSQGLLVTAVTELDCLLPASFPLSVATNSTVFAVAFGIYIDELLPVMKLVFCTISQRSRFQEPKLLAVLPNNSHSSSFLYVL
jgi:hypothetical protein